MTPSLQSGAFYQGVWFKSPVLSGSGLAAAGRVGLNPDYQTTRLVKQSLWGAHPG